MKTETKCRVAACAAGFALPRYADLPQMGLYLDQTVQYVNSYFRTFCGVELTSSMVSNYVKKGILSHPVRKKYARDQIASLMYIAVSKRCSQWKTSMPCLKCSGRTVPPGQLTTTSATRWKTACRLYSAAPGRSATLPWMPQMKAASAQHDPCSGKQNVLGLLLQRPAAGGKSLGYHSARSGVRTQKRPCLHKRKHGLCILYVQDQVSCSSPRLAALRYAKMKPSRSPSITASTLPVS